MLDNWADELNEDEETRLIKKAAREIRRRHLNVPAILFLEMHKPLSFVGSQAAIAFSPFLVPFLGFERVHDYSRLFAKRQNVDRLIDEIDKPDDDAPDSEDPCNITTPTG